MKQILFALLALAGCSSEPISEQIDSWHAEAPNTQRSGREVNVPHAEVFEVTAVAMPQAELLLKDVPAVEISNTQATELALKEITTTDGHRLFLVRGVYWNAETGGFWVTRIDNDLFVHHSSLGSSRVMGRKVLVVPLPALPTNVYVSCSAAL